MQKLLIGLFVTMGLLFFLGSDRVETPIQYSVITNQSGYELRKTETFFVSGVNSSSFNLKRGESFNNVAFNTLAEYSGVFGHPQNVAANNSNQPEAIPMTAPVFYFQNPSSSYTMTFVLPSEYKSIESIPEPTNKSVFIAEVQPQYYAVLKFSGSKDYEQSEHKAKKFIETLQNSNQFSQIDSQTWALARYNSPFTLPFLRTNQIWVEVKLN